jgi:hypothetical protein
MHDIAAEGRGTGLSARGLGRLLALGLVAGMVATAGAQSVTGRTRAPEPGDGAAAGSGWVVCAGAGVMTSGDLFTVVIPGGSAVAWAAPGGGAFNAYEFTVTLDEDVHTGLSLARPLPGRLWLRLDLSWSQADMTAEARVSETVELHLYDRLTVLMAGLTLERELVRARHYPYVLAGAALVDVGADGTEDFDQSRLGLRLGAGFHYGIDGRWGARFEIRDTIQQLDLEDHRPQTITGSTPPLAYRELGPQHFFELSVGIRGIF